MAEQEIRITKKHYRDFNDFRWTIFEAALRNKKAGEIFQQIKEEIVKFAEKNNLEIWFSPSNAPNECMLRWKEGNLAKTIDILPVVEKGEILLSVDAVKSIPNPSGPTGTVSLSEISFVSVKVDDIQTLQKALEKLHRIAKRIRDKDIRYLHPHLYGPGFPSR